MNEEIDKNILSHKLSSNELTRLDPNSLINQSMSIKSINFRKNSLKKDFKINKVAEILKANENSKLQTPKKNPRLWSTRNLQLNKNIVVKNTKLFFNKINFPDSNNFYTGMRIFRAPSVKENRCEIQKLLKERKISHMNDINNMYNTMMIKESKIYREKLRIKSGINFIRRNKNTLKNKYKINDIEDMKTNLKKNKTGGFYYKKKRVQSSCELSFFNNYKNIQRDFNSNNNIVPKDNMTISTNKTNYQTRFPFSSKKGTFYKINNKNKRKYSDSFFSNSNVHSEKESKTNEKNYLILSNNLSRTNDEINKNNDNIYISQMKFELNNAIFNSNTATKEITNLEKKIIKFKLFQNAQKERLKKLSNNNIISLENRIKTLIPLNDKIRTTYFNYFQFIGNYLRFLTDTKFFLSHCLDEENNEIYSLRYELEKLMTDTVMKQKELEYLVEIRNFLLQVKNRYIKQPSVFNTILKESSHKEQLAKLLIKLDLNPQNPNIIKFLESFPELNNYKESQNFIPKDFNKSLKKKSKYFTKLDHKENCYKLIQEYILNPGKPIFDTPEEFLIEFENLEMKDLRLIKENDEMNKIKNLYQNEYNEILNCNIEMKKYNDLSPKIELVNKLKDKNHILETNLKQLKKQTKILENNSKIVGKENSHTFFFDINVFIKTNYYKELQNYKYKGSLLLEKLIDTIKNFLKANYLNYGIDRIYTLVEPNKIDKILKISSKNINSLNHLVITTYILYLLKIYEDICEYIIDCNVKYSSIKENKSIIYKKNEEIQLNRKLYNGRKIRQLLEEKRENCIQKIMEKNSRRKLLNHRYAYDDNIVLRNKIKKQKEEEEIGIYKKNFKENEFNYYVNYNEIP